LNARSNASERSSASILRAVSMKRFDSAGSSCLRGMSATISHDSYFFSGNRNCRGSGVKVLSLYRRSWPKLGCRGSLRLTSSCLIGQPLALHASQRAIGPLNIVDSKLGAVAVAEIEFRQIPL